MVMLSVLLTVDYGLCKLGVTKFCKGMRQWTFAMNEDCSTELFLMTQ